MAAVFDREELLERIGGDEELVQDLIELFLEDYPDKIRGIQEGLSSGNPETVRVNAHGLKGSSGNLSFNVLSETAKDIELAGKAGDLKKAGELFRNLERDLEQLLPLIS